MPTFAVETGLDPARRAGVATALADAAVSVVGVPEQAVMTIVFRHVAGDEIAAGGGAFPYWPEEPPFGACGRG